MNKSKLKSYAPQARKDFIAMVTGRAAQLGLSESAGKLQIEECLVQGEVAVIGGQAFPARIAQQRAKLIERLRRSPGHWANLLRDRGDCARALVEYQRLVQESPVAPQADDAAYFAAFCEARLGRGAAARESLQRYLERYPAGRHRAEAEQALNPAR